MGCTTVRVGFEDSVFLPNGQVAERNHQLVEELVPIASRFRPSPATPAQAREIMGLTGARATRRGRDRA